jgi:hypothetical protein
MPDSILDFIKNAGLITVLTFLIVVICVLIGFGLFWFARSTAAMRCFLFVGIVPVLSGILALYLKFKYADVVLKGMATPATIAANRKEGVIDLIAGLVTGLTILLLATIRRRLIKNANG